MPYGVSDAVWAQLGPGTRNALISGQTKVLPSGDIQVVPQNLPGQTMPLGSVIIPAPGASQAVKAVQTVKTTSPPAAVMSSVSQSTTIKPQVMASPPAVVIPKKVPAGVGVSQGDWNKLGISTKKAIIEGRVIPSMDFATYSRMPEEVQTRVVKVTPTKVSLYDYKKLGPGVKSKGVVTPLPSGWVEQLEFFPTRWAGTVGNAVGVYKEATAGSGTGKKVEQGVAGFMTMLGAGALLIPVLPVRLIQNPKGTVSGVGAAFTGSFSGARHGDPWAIGETVAITMPAISPVARGIKGGYTRLHPSTLTPESLGIVVDVGRENVPAGMSKLAARELLGDVEVMQGIGEIPASRLRALQGVPDVATAVITRTPKGITDIKLKSADGDIIGHVSGMQRVNAGYIYHGTANSQLLIRQARENGFNKIYDSASKADKAILNRIKDNYLESGFDKFKREDVRTKNLLNQIQKEEYFSVKDLGAPAHHGMFWSQQAAQDFMARGLQEMEVEGVKPSPAIFSSRIGLGEIRQPPRDVLDSPTIADMRVEMEALSAKGKLKPGIYTLYKAWNGQLEYELYVSPGFKFKVAEPTWYAKGDVPKTWVQSMFGMRGIGEPIKQGKLMPVYHFMTEQAAKEGSKGVPSLAESYVAKIYGDMTLIQRYAPWRIRIRGLTKNEAEVFVDNPIMSTYRPVMLSAVGKGKGGRATAMVFNPEGKVLLTRILGQERFDLVGGSPTKRWLRSESIDKAARRELYEESGLKPDVLDHVDTFQSTFAGKGKVQTFQIFEGYSDAKPTVGSEIAEYIWWDGKSKLKYPVSEFTKEALARRNIRNNRAATTYATNRVANAIMSSETPTKALSKLKELEQTMGDEAIKAVDEGYRRGDVGFRLSDSQRSAIRTSVSSSLSGRDTTTEGRVYEASGERYVEDRTPPEGRGRPDVVEERQPTGEERRPPSSEGMPPVGDNRRPPTGEERPPTGGEERPPTGEERPPAGGEERPPTGEKRTPGYPVLSSSTGGLEIESVEGIPKHPGIVVYDMGIERVKAKPPYRPGPDDIKFEHLKSPTKGKGSEQATLRVYDGDAPQKLVLRHGFKRTSILRGEELTNTIIKPRGRGIVMGLDGRTRKSKGLLKRNRR